MSKSRPPLLKWKGVAEDMGDLLPAPDYLAAKGILRDQQWVESYFSMVLQWPKTCSISLRERQLVGLAKSLAFNWEPGILNHIDLALKTGSTPEQVTEVIKAAAAVVGLARLEMAVSAVSTVKRPDLDHLDSRLRNALKRVKIYFQTLPSCFMYEIILEDPEWLAELLTAARPAYDISPDVLAPKARSLVCLAAAAVMSWSDGTKLYSAASRRFGATNSEIHDVVKSVFKTAVSNAMAAGFRTPCHIPNLTRYRTMLSAYVENGGSKTKRDDDPLFRWQSGQDAPAPTTSKRSSSASINRSTRGNQ